MPWRSYSLPNGQQVCRPVLFGRFGDLDEVKVFILDSGADYPIAPRRTAEDLGLDWDSGVRLKLRGVSPNPSCVVDARMIEVDFTLHPLGIRFIVPFCFGSGDVPFLAGRQGLLDQFKVILDPHRKVSRLSLR